MTESRAGADVAFVPLAAVGHPTQVAAEIGSALNTPLTGDQSSTNPLVGTIGTWPLLLVLDTFEHLLAATALLVELLSTCPHLTLLVTSRARLRVTGEHVVDVPPLVGPDPRQLPELDQVAAYDAVRLFVARAQATKDAFVLSKENAAAVSGVCRRLDGLPLAIELAAARSNTFEPAALLARLERRLPLLSGGPHDQPARLQTMHTAIKWSYELLDEAEQALFRRVAVFPADFSLDAAEAMLNHQVGPGCSEGAPSWSPSAPLSDSSALDLVASLVDNSLVQPRPVVAEDPRFGLLDTLRDFALGELEAHGEALTIRRVHADYFLAVAERAAADLTSRDQAAWLNRLEIEHDNLRAGLYWAIDHLEAETALRYCVALWWFWAIRGHWAEGRDWLEQSLAMGGVLPHLRARARFALGSIALVQGDPRRSAALARESLTEHRAIDDGLGTGQSLLLLGRATQRAGFPDAARRHFAEALTRFEELGDERWAASALHNLGLVAYEKKEYDQAIDAFQEALDRWHALGFAWGLASCIPIHLADIARAQGDDVHARLLYRESLTLNREQRDESEIVGLLVGIASLTASWDAAGAGRVLGTASAMRATLGGHVTSEERRDTELATTRIHAALGEQHFVAATAAGSRMSLPEAMAEAEALLARRQDGR